MMQSYMPHVRSSADTCMVLYSSAFVGCMSSPAQVGHVRHSLQAVPPSCVPCKQLVRLYSLSSRAHSECILGKG